MLLVLWQLQGTLTGTNVRASRALAQGEDKHLLQRWSKAYLYHHEMGNLNPSRSPPYCVALAAPQNPPGKEQLWRKPELVTPQSTAQNKPTPALSAALL